MYLRDAKEMALRAPVSEAEQSAAEQVTEAALRFVADAAWRWFAANRRDVLFKRRVLGLFSLTVRVEDCVFILRALFGPPPAGSGVVV